MEELTEYYMCTSQKQEPQQHQQQTAISHEATRARMGKLLENENFLLITITAGFNE